MGNFTLACPEGAQKLKDLLVNSLFCVYKYSVLKRLLVAVTSQLAVHHLFSTTANPM